MAKQFCYQDAQGVLYPEHSALHFEPNLVPGFYDTETRVFTPSGNPQKQVGNIITDVGTGNSTKILSGLAEDKGAMTAPMNGVAFSQPVNDEIETAADSEVTEAEVTESIDGELVQKMPKKKVARKVA